MVLVTGGTGLVGAHLLAQLLEAHARVRAIRRADSDLDHVKKVFGYYGTETADSFKRIEWAIADINDLPALEAAFDGVTLVYHAAALISFDPTDFTNLMKVNAEGTANIVNLCLAHNIKKMCYVSTIGTIGKAVGGGKATEDDELGLEHINVYASSKHAAEIEVWRGAIEGLPVVMVNPGVIIGPGFWHTGSGTLFATAQKGRNFYPPGGTGFVSVYDVVKLMVALMDSTLANERYIVVAQNLSFREILEMVSKKIAKPVPTKKLRYWQLELLRVAEFALTFFTAKRRRITRATIHSLKHRDHYANDKIIKALGFEFEPLEKSIAFSAARFVEENR